jgi:hypothetical protein
MHPTLTAVSELIRPQQTTIELPNLRYTLKAPCLLYQLWDAVANGMERGGGRAAPESKPPIAVDSHDLYVEITRTISRWASYCHVDPSRYRADRLQPPKRGVMPIPPEGHLLRAVASASISTGRDVFAEKIAETATGWAKRITAMLSGEPEQRSVRGASCKACEAATVQEWRDEDGRLVSYTIPAVIITTWLEQRWAACLACGWTASLGALSVSLDDQVFEAA